ncbi:hypothetical protein EII22_09055 [Coriobacteriales bacterium OH1046]|nr:hypothetical protein EII22_09055 [Coriobacteriales bacterium OH1046]
MKRRMTSADRWIDAFLAANPELADLRAGTYAASGEEAAAAAVWLMGRRGLPAPSKMGTAELLRAQSEDISLAVPEDVALWSRWRSCRHVFDFDPDLAAALAASDSPDSMPLDALARLPYPIQYVQAPISSWSPSGRAFSHPGFFAWRDTQRDAGGGVRDVLLVFLVREGRPCVRLSLDLACGTVGGAADSLVDADLALYGRLGGPPGGFDAASARSRARETAGDALSLLLYLVSDGADREVVYRPSGGGGGTRRLSPSTIHSVGARAGAALRAARIRYGGGGGSGPSGRTVSAHVRAGHWHCHWHGAVGSPERRLVPHWQPPVLVNPGGREDGSTVVHRAGR